MALSRIFVALGLAVLVSPFRLPWLEVWDGFAIPLDFALVAAVLLVAAWIGRRVRLGTPVRYLLWRAGLTRDWA